MNPSTHFITITILLTCSKKIYFENKIKHISFNYYHDVICEMILEAHVTPDIQNTRPPRWPNHSHTIEGQVLTYRPST